MSLHTFFGNKVYKKLGMTEFCSDYNLLNLAKEKTCYKIPEIQICIDLLQIADCQKVF